MAVIDRSSPLRHRADVASMVAAYINGENRNSLAPYVITLLSNGVGISDFSHRSCRSQEDFRTCHLGLSNPAARGRGKHTVVCILARREQSYAAVVVHDRRCVEHLGSEACSS